MILKKFVSPLKTPLTLLAALSALTLAACSESSNPKKTSPTPPDPEPHVYGVQHWPPDQNFIQTYYEPACKKIQETYRDGENDYSAAVNAYRPNGTAERTGAPIDEYTYYSVGEVPVKILELLSYADRPSDQERVNYQNFKTLFVFTYGDENNMTYWTCDRSGLHEGGILPLKPLDRMQ